MALQDMVILSLVANVSGVSNLVASATGVAVATVSEGSYFTIFRQCDIAPTKYNHILCVLLDLKTTLPPTSLNGSVHVTRHLSQLLPHFGSS